MQPATALIGVMTMDKSSLRRKRIRETYGRHWRSRANGTEGVRVIFVQGQPREALREEVYAEAKGELELLCAQGPYVHNRAAEAYLTQETCFREGDKWPQEVGKVWYRTGSLCPRIL